MNGGRKATPQKKELPRAKRKVADAVSFARWHARSTTTPYPRLCLKFVREAWGLPAVSPTAQHAWDNAEVKHKWTGDTEDIPWGAPVFAKRPNAGPKDAGHVFITGGHNRKGERIFRSNDILTVGGIDNVPIRAFKEKWGYEILGWTEDLNGFKLNLPPSPNQRKKRK